MNNLLSYCGLTDSRMSASEKDLPVYLSSFFSITEWLSHFNKVVDDNYYHSIKVHWIISLISTSSMPEKLNV